MSDNENIYLSKSEMRDQVKPDEESDMNYAFEGMREALTAGKDPRQNSKVRFFISKHCFGQKKAR